MLMSLEINSLPQLLSITQLVITRGWRVIELVEASATSALTDAL